MTYVWAFIGGISLLVISKMIRWYMHATRKPKSRPLPPEYAHTIPMGAIHADTAPAYTLQTQDSTYNMLYLPGNAALGAYSAGIACALQQKQAIHTIVGISSGALATLFLYANDTDTMEQVLTNIDTPKVLSLKPRLFSIIFGYSFTDNSPLQLYLAEFITDTFIDRLQHQYHQGYRAYVISHNIDIGQSVFWDIGAISNMDIPYAERRQILIRAVVASTSVPIVFNPMQIPVQVDGTTYTQTHIDGAVSAHTVFADWMTPDNMADFKQKTITIAQSNAYTDIAPITPTLWKTLVIGLKSLSNAYHSAYHASLKSTAVFAHTHNMSVRINQISTDTILTDNDMDFSNHIINLYFSAGMEQTKHDKIIWTDLSGIHKRI